VVAVMLAVISALVPASAIAAPPADDDFALATIMPTFGGEHGVDTSDATSEVDEPNHFTALGARQSVWVRWTAPTSGTASVDTSDAAFDTVIGVYTGASLGSLVRVASGDDVLNPDDPDDALQQTRVAWTAVAGVTYSIAIDGSRSGDAGAAVVTVRMPGPTLDVEAPSDDAVSLGALAFEATLGHDVEPGTATMRAHIEICSIPTGSTGCVQGGGAIEASGTTVGWQSDGSFVSWSSPVLAPGTWYWHARVEDDAGISSPWSESRRFDVTSDVPAVPLPVSPNAGSVINARRPTLVAHVRHPRPAALNSVEFELCTVFTSPAQSCVAAGGTVQAAASTPPTLLDDEDASLRFTAAIPAGTYFWRARATDDAPITTAWSAARSIELLPTPANDDFVDAILVSGSPTSWTGSNVDASAEPGEPSLLQDRTSVWVRWTATATGVARFADCGSDFDGVLGVYQGATVDALTTIGTNDDGCAGYAGSGSGGVVQVPVTIGGQYFVRLGGFDGAAGTTDVDVDVEPPAPNDDLASATVVPGPGGSIATDFAGATREAGESEWLSTGSSSSNLGTTVWYRWTAPSNGMVELAPDTMSDSLDVGVFTGSTHPSLVRVAGAFITSASAPLRWTATAGTTYRIGLQAPGRTSTQSLTLQPTLPYSPVLLNPNDGLTTSQRPTLGAKVVHADTGATSTIEFELCTAAPTSTQTCVAAGGTVIGTGSSTSGLASGETGVWRSPLPLAVGAAYWRARATDSNGRTGLWSSTRSITLAASPPNDDFEDPELLVGYSASAAGTIVDATEQQGEPGWYDTVWYSWVAPADLEVSVDTCGAGFNTGTLVYTGSTLQTLSGVGQSIYDCWPQGHTTFLATGGTTYRIMVGGGGTTGPFTLTLTSSTPAPKAPTLISPSSGASLLEGSSLSARFGHSQAGRTGTLEFELCSDALCATVLDTGLSGSGIAIGSDGSHTLPTGLPLDTTLYWRSRGIDDLLVVGPWSGTRTVVLRSDAPLAPTLVGPPSYADRSDPVTFDATFTHIVPTRTGTLAFQLCSDSSCASVIDSGTAGPGLLVGQNGSWTSSTPLTDGQTYYWRARGTDELATTGSWSTIRELDSVADAPAIAEPGEPDGATTGDTTPTLHATFRHTNTSRSGHVEFEVCTDITCTTAFDSGSSPIGLVDGDEGSWTVTSPLAVEQTWYWRARVVDDLAGTGPWASASTDVIDVPANDDFESAAVLPPDRARISGSMINATAQAGEPRPGGWYAAAQTVWYQWTAPADMTAQLATESSFDDIYFAIYTGADIGSLTRVTDGNEYNDLAYPRTFDAVGGTTYFIQVDRGNGDSPGPFTLLLNQDRFPSVPRPLDGALPDNDIDAQLDDAQLHATWSASTDAFGIVTGYDACVQVSNGPFSWDWDPVCVVDWTNVGNVTATTVPLAMTTGDRYRVCVRAVATDVVGIEGCSSGVDIVAALPAEPPRPTLISPGNREEIALLPTLVAAASFNSPADTGTLEFELHEAEFGEGWGCGEGTPLIESGAWGPGLAQGDSGSFATTISPSNDRACWRARTVDADGDVSEWTDFWHFTHAFGGGSTTVKVESPQIEAELAPGSSTALAEFTISIDSTETIDVFVEDGSDTEAATCTCGTPLLDVPLGDEDPEEWLEDAHAGHAGLTVLDVKGDDGSSRSVWRWGYAPEEGADLHDVEQSNWTSITGPSDPRYLGNFWGRNDMRIGYRMELGPSPMAGTYTSTLTFTGLATIWDVG
jgi:hypothetical protein